MNLVQIKILANALESQIDSYLNGSSSEMEFINQYPKALAAFDNSIDENPWHPLDLLVPTESNSERAWKTQMIAMQRQHIAELEATLEGGNESYAEMLSSNERKKLCKQALVSIRSQIQSVSAKMWVQENLVDDVEFNFKKSDGTSIFGASRVLYSTIILQESFLLTALSGALAKPKFHFSEILNAVRDANETTDCFWARCSEIDGAIAHVEIALPREDSAFDQHDQLVWIEHTTGQEVQWGDCYLLLIPYTHLWMLKISNNFRNLSIELHGDNNLINSVMDTLRDLNSASSKGEL